MLYSWDVAVVLKWNNSKTYQLLDTFKERKLRKEKRRSHSAQRARLIKWTQSTCSICQRISNCLISFWHCSFRHNETPSHGEVLHFLSSLLVSNSLTSKGWDVAAESGQNVCKIATGSGCYIIPHQSLIFLQSNFIKQSIDFFKRFKPRLELQKVWSLVTVLRICQANALKLYFCDRWII